MHATTPAPKGKLRIPTVLQQAKELQARLTKAAHKVADDLEQARSKDLRSRLANSLGSLVRSWREVEDAKQGIVKRKSPTFADPAARTDDEPDDQPAASLEPAALEPPTEPPKESLSPGTVPTPPPGEGPAGTGVS